MVKTNPRSLDHYLSLQYDLIVAHLGDGEMAFKAYAKELDQDAFYGLGSTREEAIESFEEVRSELIPYYFENDIPIPKPESKEENLPSGKFLVRTSPYTHKHLIDLALDQGMSLNATVNKVLGEYTTSAALVDKFADQMSIQVCDQLQRLEHTWGRYLAGVTRPIYRTKCYEQAA